MSDEDIAYLVGKMAAKRGYEMQQNFSTRPSVQREYERGHADGLREKERESRRMTGLQ